MAGYLGNIPVPQATQTREVFTATASQTSFATAGYPVGFVDVWLNGVKLINGTDFTATNGSDVVLAVGAAAGDTVEVISNSTFEVNSQNFTGGLTVNNDGATVLTVDRATSDGSIVDFKKDGSKVGSVGVQLGGLFVGHDDVGLLFYTGGQDRILPRSSTTYLDGVLDVGDAGSRFKDLYLSGGVYLGGTGAANKLDDYEEGIWTPSITATTSGTITLDTSYDKMSYTKVGRLVTVTGQIVVGSVSSPSGVLRMSLPFASIDGLEDRADYCCLPITAYLNGATGAGAGYYSGFIFISNNSTTGDIFITRTSAASETSIASWVAAGSDFFFNFTYIANS